MIYGIGIDIVQVERMKEAAARWGERFLQRVFTENEIAYCCEKRNPFPSLAVRFAAKEAVIKAIGSNISVRLTDIEVANDNRGKPFIKPKGRLQEFFREHLLCKTHLSLSHEKDYGIACVVLEKEEN